LDTALYKKVFINRKSLAVTRLLGPALSLGNDFLQTCWQHWPPGGAGHH